MKHRYCTLAFLAVTALAAPAALAAVPDFVTYSGRLTDGTGWGQSQTVALTFRIYDKAEGGTMLHEQAFENAAIEDGYFSVMLTGVAEVFGANDQTWLTVCVGKGCTADDDLKPRQQVGSVPYAVTAGHALEAGHSKTVDNPFCGDSNCTNAGLSNTDKGMPLDPGESGVVTAYCTKEYPIPVVGGCYVNGKKADIWSSYPANWHVPQNWVSDAETLRAGWSCTATNTYTEAVGVVARLVCRKQ